MNFLIKCNSSRLGNILIRPISVGINYCSLKTNKASTIDPIEQKFFQEILTNVDWWEAEGLMKPLHTFNKIRVPFIKEEIRSRNLRRDCNVSFSPLKDLQILEVGCAAGILTEALAEGGAAMTGFDVSDEFIIYAKEHAQKNKYIETPIKYINDTLENHVDKFKDTFDVVISSEVIEHVQNPELYLKSCIDVLKPGGSLFVTTWNKTFLSWFVAIFLAEIVIKTIPKGAHHWDKFISLEKMKGMLLKESCCTIRIQGATFNPFNRKWYNLPTANIYYMLHAVKY